MSTRLTPRHPVDLTFTLLGTKTVTRRAGVHWWVTHTPEGPGTVAFRSTGGEIRADAWGQGAPWAVEQLPRLLGAHDEVADFEPRHPVVAKLVSRFPSPRIGASGRWFEALATAAIGQRVVTADARASRHRLARAHGDPPPGDPPAPLFPTPAAVLRLTDHDFHRTGIERSRARVIRLAAKYADRLERLDTASGAEARAWLQRLPGVGPWTAALTTACAGGDTDAVPVGDLHIPRTVCHALAGEPDGDDQRMLELLEPYAGHRQRVVRMVKLAGAGPPRHRPAPTRYDIRRI